MTSDPADPRGNLGEALEQLIAMRLLPQNSRNPWNKRDRLGTEDRTYRSSQREDIARLEADVRRHFDELETQRRARLVSVSTRREATEADTGRDRSRLVVAVEFDDLELQQRRRLEVSRA